MGGAPPTRSAQLAARLRGGASPARVSGSCSSSYAPSYGCCASEPPLLRRLGDAWVDSCESVLLKVPSAIVPFEHVFLLNPAHPATADIAVSQPVPGRRRSSAEPGGTFVGRKSALPLQGVLPAARAARCGGTGTSRLRALRSRAGAGRRSHRAARAREPPRRTHPRRRAAPPKTARWSGSETDPAPRMDFTAGMTTGGRRRRVPGLC